jgi:hypothetical protein
MLMQTLLLAASHTDGLAPLQRPTLHIWQGARREGASHHGAPDGQDIHGAGVTCATAVPLAACLLFESPVTVDTIHLQCKDYS